MPAAGLPLVGVDNVPIADLAFDHFRERGFRHVAWCDLFRLGKSWIDIRRERFLERARQAGVAGHCFQARRLLARPAHWSHAEMTGLMNWLGSLPRPVAILACDDEQAHLVLDATLTLGLKVPGDVAVLGIDNDEVFCRASSPSLSSVDVNASAVGYEAAAALALLLNAAVGQSATSAIMQVRLARVKADLFETELPLKSIARRAGFASVQHLANLFRSRAGLTSGRYRRDMRH